MSILIALISVAIISGITYQLGRSKKIMRDGSPLKYAPNTLPLIGNGLLFLQNRHKLFSWFVKCEQLFGLETFAISVPSLPPGVVISDPKNLEFVLKNEDIFSKGDFFKVRSWDLFGHGIINADGELWKVQRKAGLQFLNIANMKILTDNVLPKYLDVAETSLIDSKGSVIDLAEVFLELTTQLMGQMAYGMEMHASDTFSKAFEYASGKTGERFQNPIWKVTETVTGSQFRNAISEVKDFGNKIVAHAIMLRTSKHILDARSCDGKVSGSLINSLLNALDNTQVVADAALNYLSAGRDTTAEALTWTFYLLMRNPKVMNHLREVIDHDSEITPTANTYAMAIFYETLRLYPPVPFEIKQSEKNTMLPDNTLLPKSTVVFWSIWAMNRSNILWGEDSAIFRPERWLSNDGKLVTKTSFEFPVFNGGTRTCLGKKMAEAIAVSVITQFIKQFDFQSLDDEERVSKNSLTLPMEGGLPCSVRVRHHEKGENTNKLRENIQ